MYKFFVNLTVANVSANEQYSGFKKSAHVLCESKETSPMWRTKVVCFATEFFSAKLNSLCVLLYPLLLSLSVLWLIE